MEMKIDFKNFINRLIPAVIQDATTKNVLMLGYMNEEALEITLKTKKITFFSRSKNRIWTKGEESGNYLNLVSVANDCDQDTLLFQVNPDGPICHKGTDTCWAQENKTSLNFLKYLENIIEQRKDNAQFEQSYVASLFKKGINKIAQKVGEEAVELVIESKDDNDLLFLNESADLLFHFMILLQTKGFRLKDVEETLRSRHNFDK